MKNQKIFICFKKLCFISSLCVILLLYTSCPRVTDNSISYTLFPDQYLTYTDSTRTVLTGLKWDVYEKNFKKRPLHIEIPASVTTIQQNAFNKFEAGKKNLQMNKSGTNPVKITFAEGSKLTTIENYAFYGCTALTKIILPKDLEILNSEAFYSCTALTSITLPEGLTTIGDRVFARCTGFKVQTNKGLPIIINCKPFDTDKIGKNVFEDSNITIEHIAFPTASDSTPATKIWVIEEKEKLFKETNSSFMDPKL